MKVRVYYNLHKACWSIKAMEGPLKGRVVAHAAGVALMDARTVVSQAGRERVIREGKKNVHAFIEGQVTAVQGLELRYSYPLDVYETSNVEAFTDLSGGEWREVKYNPYKTDHFYLADTEDSTEGLSLHSVVLTDTRKVWATGGAL